MLLAPLAKKKITIITKIPSSHEFFLNALINRRAAAVEQGSISLQGYLADQRYNYIRASCNFVLAEVVEMLLVDEGIIRVSPGYSVMQYIG